MRNWIGVGSEEERKHGLFGSIIKNNLWHELARGTRVRVVQVLLAHNYFRRNKQRKAARPPSLYLRRYQLERPERITCSWCAVKNRARNDSVWQYSQRGRFAPQRPATYTLRFGACVRQWDAIREPKYKDKMFTEIKFYIKRETQEGLRRRRLGIPSIRAIVCR